MYGIYLFVTLANGAGFSGTLSVPELRQLNPRFAVNLPTSWAAVGTWMGVIQDVVWSGDVRIEKAGTSLDASAELRVVAIHRRFHQNNPGNLLTAGDLFVTGGFKGRSARPCPTNSRTVA